MSMDVTNNYGVFWSIYPREKGLTCIEYAVKASLGVSVFKGQETYRTIHKECISVFLRASESEPVAKPNKVFLKAFLMSLHLTII